ncbi:MAG: hypothetical protein GY777_24505 [Candidatus Brocadiaceae bacterium]|nr:hypothetical protein [Candidatus Brocadiaceae bacterium]
MKTSSSVVVRVNRSSIDAVDIDILLRKYSNKVTILQHAHLKNQETMITNKEIIILCDNKA